MNRNVHSSGLLAHFFVNGAACSGADLNHLDAAASRLVTAISYCLLTCESHIRHSKGSLRINLKPGNDVAWEVANWAELPPALRQALLQAFVANALTPAS